jgi:hypothetical protein
MLDEAYASHLKQYVVVTDARTGAKTPLKCKQYVHALPKVIVGPLGCIV